MLMHGCCANKQSDKQSACVRELGNGGESWAGSITCCRTTSGADASFSCRDFNALLGMSTHEVLEVFPVLASSSQPLWPCRTELERLHVAVQVCVQWPSLARPGYITLCFTRVNLYDCGMLCTGFAHVR